MPKEVRSEILTRYRLRYKGRTRKEKSKLLNEFCETWEFSRKHAIKLLGQSIEIRKKRPGPSVKYGPRMVNHLASLWESMGRICSVRVHAALPIWLPYYQDPDCDSKIQSLLLQVSPSTIDRLLRSRRVVTKGFSMTKPGAYLKSRIPMEILDGKVRTPGTVQADTVAHCGGSMAGQFAHSLTITDLFCGWTENRASWTKGGKEVLEQIRDIRRSLPFLVKHFACDNGSEFINESLVNYFDKHKDPGKPSIKFTHGRAYKKNDQCYVEQKNDSHVRKIFGYERFDHPELVQMMNDIYRNHWNPLQNFFLPNLKLIKKHRVGAKVKKEYDSPKTPYARLMESDSLSDTRKENLQLSRDGLNPIQLQTILQEKLKIFTRELRKYHALIVTETMESA